MDWTIVVSVLVALLLWPMVMALVGALVFLTTATVLRGRFRELKDRHVAHCKQMCNPGELAAAAASLARPRRSRANSAKVLPTSGKGGQDERLYA